MGDIKLTIDLKMARRLLGLTQTELAKKAGVDLSVVSKLEAGKRKRPSYEVAVRIAEALGLEPRELFLIDHQDDAA